MFNAMNSVRRVLDETLFRDNFVTQWRNSSGVAGLGYSLQPLAALPAGGKAEIGWTNQVETMATPRGISIVMNVRAQ